MSDSEGADSRTVSGSSGADSRVVGGSEGGAVAGARAEIDAANAADPRSHDGMPLALVQGRRAEEWVVRLDPGASDALRLAARAHHLRRWAVPRSDYPAGRTGYLQWRRSQGDRHAQDLAAILDRAGVESSVSARAAEIVAKRGLGSDLEVQTFEDAVSLTFLETELRPLADRLDDDAKVAGIVAKTLAKMSATGRDRAASGSVGLDGRSQRILEEAWARFAEGEKPEDR